MRHIPKPSDTSVVFTPEQVEWLKRAFPEPILRPGIDMDVALYKAGQASVVESVSKRAYRLTAVEVQRD